MAGMGESRLSRAQDEINPLKAKTDNPVKKAARATAKARSSKDASDIVGAANKTRMASLYAKSHGYPNLTKQLSQHKKMLQRYAAVMRKHKAAQTKAAKHQRVTDLKAKLFKARVNRARPKPRAR
jgi:hypothetical protein